MSLQGGGCKRRCISLTQTRKKAYGPQRATEHTRLMTAICSFMQRRRRWSRTWYPSATITLSQQSNETNVEDEGKTHPPQSAVVRSWISKLRQKLYPARRREFPVTEGFMFHATSVFCRLHTNYVTHCRIG